MRWMFALAFLAMAACAPQPLAPARAYNAEITRDQFGVATVHGHDDAETSAPKLVAVMTAIWIA